MGHKPHFLRKILLYVRMNMVVLLLSFVIFCIAILAVVLISLGMINYFQMEPFSRKQMLSQMGIYMIVGVVQAAVFVGMFQIANYFQMSGGLLGRLGQEKISLAKTEIKWDDVIGMESAKKEAWEVVELLRDQHLLTNIGGKIVKGTLMIGPPGCGKTYLAKAMANACGLPMISAIGSEFVGIFVGQGAAQMRSLFRQARSLAAMEGGCIIFIDEIDAFARPRMADTGFGGGISHNATINQFLTEMDGLRKKENNIVVIAATNFGEQELDSAIMRAGRFDRKIYINLPNLEERRQLFNFYLKRVLVGADVKSEIMARRTLWNTPADIDAMIREAGIIALREKRKTINMKDLSAAYDRITYGDKSNIKMNQEDKLWTAYHEAGHAILAYLCHPKDDVVKATIIPRKGALGFVSHLPREEHYSHNKEYFLAQIKICIASYVAEQMKYNSSSSGVGGSPAADFNRALTIARNMVWSYGMGKSGLIGDYKRWKSNPYEEAMLSPDMIKVLEADVQEILQTCLKDVRDILSSHKELFEFFANELFKKEELEYDEIQAIFDQFNVKPISGRPITHRG